MKKIEDLNHIDSDCIFDDSVYTINLGCGNSVSTQGWNLDTLYNYSAITNDLATIDNTQPLNININVENYEDISYYGSAEFALILAINNILDKFPFGLWGTASAALDDTILIPISSIKNIRSIPLPQTSITHTNLSSCLITTGSNMTPYTINLNYVVDTDLVIVTNLMFNTDFFDGCPIYIFPNSGDVHNFEANLSSIEYELYRNNRSSNIWPRTGDGVNLEYDGSGFDQFVTTERVKAVSADTNNSNILCRLYTPKSFIDYDTQNGDFLNLIKVYGQQYDDVLNYINQMAYVHTIGYTDYNCVPRDIVNYLAKQWSFSLFNDVNRQSYDKFLFPQIENYVSGSSLSSSFYISAKDLNYEKWRRILINIPQLYKRKGTRGVFDIMFLLYNLPSQLATLNEYVEVYDDGNYKNLIKDNVKSYYVSSGDSQLVGSGITSGFTSQASTGFYNSRLVELAISTSNAVEFDVWEWGKINSPTLSNGYNSTIVTSLTINQDSWYLNVENATIPSIGRFTASTYSYLEGVYDSYLSDSTNKLSFFKLEPYVEFIEDSYIWMFNQFMPVSVMFRGFGREYRNLRFYRPKFQWQPDRLVEQWVEPLITYTGETLNISKSLCFRSDVSNYLTSDVEYDNNLILSVDDYLINSVLQCSKTESIVSGITLSTVDLITAHTTNVIITSTTTNVNLDILPLANIKLIGPKSGVTSDFYNYNNSMVQTSLNNRLLINFTGNNFVCVGSMSAVAVRVELFKKKENLIDDREIILIDSNENYYLNIGTYDINDVSNIQMFDRIRYGNVDTHIISVDKLYKKIITKPMLNVGSKKLINLTKVYNYFDWCNPIQSMVYSNVSAITNNFDSIGVNFSILSGWSNLGGKDLIYNSEILVDKEEYFVRIRAEQQYSGDNHINFCINYLSGSTNMACQEWLVTEYNNDIYYGNYFMFMTEPKQPNLIEYPAHNVSDITISSSSSNSALFKWNGTDDTDKIEVQFLPVGTSIGLPTIVNPIIVDNMFNSGNSAVFAVEYIPSDKSKGDASFYHTVQTTLNPSSWYWWRIKNMRGKINIFGYEALSYVVTSPKCFLTGSGSSGVEQGRIIPQDGGDYGPSSGFKDREFLVP